RPPAATQPTLLPYTTLFRSVAAAIEHIGKAARDVEGREDMAHVATISAGDSSIGDTIAEAFEKVGKDGVIQVEESQTFGIEIELDRKSTRLNSSHEWISYAV